MKGKRANYREKSKFMLEDLRDKIRLGEYNTDELIPSEHELCEQYGLSRPSVRKELSVLTQEGLIQPIRGKGCVIVWQRQMPVTLRMFWYTPSYEFPVIEKVVSRFNEQHDDVKIELLPVDNRHYPDFVFSGGPMPDLFGLNNHFFMELMEKGGEQLILSVEDVRSLYTDDYYTFQPHFTWNELLYAAPITFSPIVLAYNKSLLCELGIELPHSAWNWNDLLHVALKCTKVNERGTERYGFAFTSSIHRWALFVMQNGGKLGIGGKPVAGDPDTFEALRFMQALMYDYQVTPVYSVGSARLAEDLFWREKVAMVMTSYYLLGQLEQVSFQSGIVRFPQGKLDATLTIATGIAISKTCKHAEAAKRVIDYFLNETTQAFIKENGHTLPIMKKVATSRQYPHFPYAGEGYYCFIDAMDNVRSLKDLGLSLQNCYELERAMDVVWANLETVEQAWDEFYRKSVTPTTEAASHL